jgi:hypothetical protein
LCSRLFKERIIDRRSFAKGALLTGLGASAVLASDQKPTTIKADGVTDDTVAIQAELNAKKKTGGTLILPPGKYLVAGHLVIPDGVALEGVHSAPVYKRPMTGTVILATGGRDNEDAPPLFKMGASTAIRNLTVYYPEQKSDDIRPYPWTFDISPTVGGGGASDNTLEHITMINSYNGIKISHNNRHRIRSVHGCVLRRGLYVVSCTDVGRIDNVHFHGCYWWKKIRNSDGSWGKVN